MSTEAQAASQSQNTNTIVTADDFYKEESQVQTPSETKPAENQTPEQKTQEQKPVESKEGETKPAEEKKEEAGEIVIKEPENFVLNSKIIEEVTAFAKEHKLDSATAQKILERENGLVASLLAAQEKQYEEETAKWPETVKTDKELGGDNFKESAAFANRALKAYGSPELIKILEETKYGNHPEVVRLLARIGRAAGDGKFIKGDANTLPKERPVEDLFYGETSN
jgi:hypothetical protein